MRTMPRGRGRVNPTPSREQLSREPGENEREAGEQPLPRVVELVALRPAVDRAALLSRTVAVVPGDRERQRPDPHEQAVGAAACAA